MLLAAELRGDGIEQNIIPLVGTRESVRGSPGISIASARNGVLSIIPAVFRCIREVRRSEKLVMISWMYHSWPVALALKRMFPARVKLFLYCRHGDMASLKPVTRLVARLSIKAARWMNVPIVFNSREAERNHKRIVSDIRSVVIPNGVRVSAANIASQRQRPCVVAFLGRNHWDKGADLLPEIVLKILTSCPEARFVVAGPGMKRFGDEILRRLAQGGFDAGRVEVSDSVEDVDAFLSSVSVLVIPSRAESFPNVLIEAMAAGTLVACSSVGEMPEILGGIIDTAKSTEDLTALAARLCSISSDQAAELGRRLSARALEKYEISQVAKTHLQLWQED